VDLRLRQLSGSIRIARDAVKDFIVTADAELEMRYSVRDRPAKRFREDQQEIRALARAAEGELTELRRFINVSMRRISPSGR
jgi:hypothetical protein